MGVSMKVKDLIKQLEGYDPEETLAVSIWSRDDVLSYLGENPEMAAVGVDLDGTGFTDQVLTHMERRFDANSGLNWDTLGFAIEAVEGANHRT